MIKGFIPLTLALWAGGTCAQEAAFFGGDLVLSLPSGVAVGREFGQGDDVYGVELASRTVEEVWKDSGRSDELPDMDRMEAAFGLGFQSTNCADYANTSVLPTKCKYSMAISILASRKSAPDSGELLGNQLGLLAADVDELWTQGSYAEILTNFCNNALHAHRVEVSRSENSVLCISERPAFAPLYTSFRLLINDDYAVVMFAQNTAAETDVIMTYGVDPFLTLIEGATNIEGILLEQSNAYVRTNGRNETYLLDVLAGIKPVP